MTLRCSFEGCKKKIKITDWKCKCDNYYCIHHKDLIIHKCKYLIIEKEQHKKRLEERLLDAKFSKLMKM